MWRAVVEHWISWAALTILTFLSTAVERTALAGQVQQLTQLPGQQGLDAVAKQVATVLSVKAVHVALDALRAATAARLGSALEREDRDSAGASAEPRESGARLVVVEAAPKLVVEAAYATVGALAALYTSTPLAAFFVAHEVLAGQLVGACAGALSARRDAKAAVFQNVAAEVAAGAPDDAAASKRLAAADVAAADAQNFLERFLDAGQLLGISSFVVACTALVDRRVVDAADYQKVMLFATTAMQSGAEIAQALDKAQRGTEKLATSLRAADLAAAAAATNAPEATTSPAVA
mmetsp:Transcript_8242/g.33936  ORF Transcript_8242/g.33936 Transcript_8242/m.33936 type:complete len:293 (+) Transcript_8242:729-1607(+)